MAEINEVIHQPVRLKILAVLAGLKPDAEVEFMFLRDQLTVTNGNLGAHLEKLESAGYIKVRKTFVRRKPRTFVRLTVAGRRAFEDHVAALKQIMGFGE